MTVRQLRNLALPVLACALIAGTEQVLAQVVGNGNQLPSNAQAMFPMQGMAAQAGQGLSSQQLQSLMMMRALQGRGRHQVHTGFPQYIPMGNGGFMDAPATLPQVGEPTTTHQSSSQKRVEARKLREEQKRAAAQDKSKKTKGAKKTRDEDKAAAAK